MKQALLAALVCLTLVCCKKHAATAALTINWPCDIIDDSATLANGLTGTWTWTKYAGNNGQVIAANKTVTVTFNTNATFAVTENGATTTQGTWKLESASSNQWQLTLSNPNNYLVGWVRVCQNQIAFLDGYVDGPDNYFEKEK